MPWYLKALWGDGTKPRHLDRRRFPDYGSSRPCQRPQTYLFPFTTASELTPRLLMIPKVRLYHYTVYHCSACIGSPIRRLSPFMAEISDWAPISATQLDIQAKCLGVSEKNCLLNHFLKKKIVVWTRQSLSTDPGHFPTFLEWIRPLQKRHQSVVYTCGNRAGVCWNNQHWVIYNLHAK